MQIKSYNIIPECVISPLVIGHSVFAYISFFFHVYFQIETHNQCVIIQEKESIEVPFGN